MQAQGQNGHVTCGGVRFSAIHNALSCNASLRHAATHASACMPRMAPSATLSHSALPAQVFALRLRPLLACRLRLPTPVLRDLQSWQVWQAPALRKALAKDAALATRAQRWRAAGGAWARVCTAARRTLAFSQSSNEPRAAGTSCHQQPYTEAVQQSTAPATQPQGRALAAAQKLAAYDPVSAEWVLDVRQLQLWQRLRLNARFIALAVFLAAAALLSVVVVPHWQDAAAIAHPRADAAIALSIRQNLQPGALRWLLKAHTSLPQLQRAPRAWLWWHHPVCTIIDIDRGHCTVLVHALRQGAGGDAANAEHCMLITMCWCTRAWCSLKRVHHAGADFSTPLGYEDPLEPQPATQSPATAHLKLPQSSASNATSASAVPRIVRRPSLRALFNLHSIVDAVPRTPQLPLVGLALRFRMVATGSANSAQRAMSKMLRQQYNDPDRSSAAGGVRWRAQQMRAAYLHGTSARRLSCGSARRHSWRRAHVPHRLFYSVMRQHGRVRCPRPDNHRAGRHSGIDHFAPQCLLDVA